MTLPFQADGGEMDGAVGDDGLPSSERIEAFLLLRALKRMPVTISGCIIIASLGASCALAGNTAEREIPQVCETVRCVAAVLSTALKALNMNLEWTSANHPSRSASAGYEATPVKWSAWPSVGIVQVASDLIAIADVDERLTFVSDVAESTLGLGPRFLIGRSLLDLVLPDDWAEMRTALDRALQTEAPVGARIHLLDACGAPHECEAAILNRLSHPFVRGFMLTFRELP